MDPSHTLETIKAVVKEAYSGHQSLTIVGGASKEFYGRKTLGRPLPVGSYQGIVAYEPTELVITARAGTPLGDIDPLLAQQSQMLPFEPPRFGPTATLGGTIACGLAGPRRPYSGAVRDYVLGLKCLNSQGEVLTFGGQVMKNVAGFDVSRLLTGAMGTLGIILEVSLKTLPSPETEKTIRFEMSMAKAINQVNQWAARPLPLSAACFDGQSLYLRLSGATPSVTATAQRLGGEEVPEGDDYWGAIREHRLPFFAGDIPLWRLSVPPATAPLDLPGDWLLDWGGAQRWLRSEIDAALIRRSVAKLGGHSVLFRGGAPDAEVFDPLSPPMRSLHQRLKTAFDPHSIFNPGRLYADL